MFTAQEYTPPCEVVRRGKVRVLCVLVSVVLVMVETETTSKSMSSEVIMLPSASNHMTSSRVEGSRVDTRLTLHMRVMLSPAIALTPSTLTL